MLPGTKRGFSHLYNINTYSCSGKTMKVLQLLIPGRKFSVDHHKASAMWCGKPIL